VPNPPRLPGVEFLVAGSSERSHDSPTEFRQITREEISAWCAALAVGFFDVPDAARNLFVEANFDNQRTIGAFENGKIVGTYASFTTPVSLPGGTFTPANAVAGVTVLPTHRGRAILRSAITADLANAKDRGDAVAMLNASKFGIYARFGFGVATETIDCSIDTRGIEFRASGATSQRKRPPVELVAASEAVALCQPVYQHVQRQVAGIIERPRPYWQRSFGLLTDLKKWEWNGHVAITRDEHGTVDGFVRYCAGKGDWDTGRPNETLVVNELVTGTPQAHRQILEYLCTMAWVAKVTMIDRAVDDDSHLFLADERRVTRSRRLDQLWARALHVPALLTTRRYETADRVTVEIIDEAGLANGRWTLDASPDGATCRKAKGRADVTMHVSELGSIAFGGQSFDAFVRTGRADEHVTGAANRVDRLFRTTRAPWNLTPF
jgi:predicted acetyltransferase